MLNDAIAKVLCRRQSWQSHFELQLTSVFFHNRVINHTWRLSHGAEVQLGSGVTAAWIFSLSRSSSHQISFKMIIPAVREAQDLCSEMWELLPFISSRLVWVCQSVGLCLSVCRPFGRLVSRSVVSQSVWWSACLLRIEQQVYSISAVLCPCNVKLSYW